MALSAVTGRAWDAGRGSSVPIRRMSRSVRSRAGEEKRNIFWWTAGDRVHVQVGDGGYDVVIRSIEKDAGDEDEIRKF